MDHPVLYRVALWVGIAIAIYLMFLPSIVAFNRKHPKRIGILILNVVLGWFFLGWVLAMILAMSDRRFRELPNVATLGYPDKPPVERVVEKRSPLVSIGLLILLLIVSAIIVLLVWRGASV